jgi:hypothetical protein
MGEVVVLRSHRSQFPLFLAMACAALGGPAGCSIAHEGLGGPTTSGATRGDVADAALSDDAGPVVGGAVPAPEAGVPQDAGAPEEDAAGDAATDQATADAGAFPDAAGTMDVNPPGDKPRPDCPDTPDLLLCMRFEGAVTDESPARWPIAPSNVGFVDGPSGSAADLHPPEQITLADGAPFYNPTVTIEAWIEPRALDGATPIVEHQGQYGLTVLPDGTAVCAAGTASALRAGAVSVGAWTSLACTIDPRAVALWIDGQKVAESAAAALATPPASRVTVGWGGTPETSFDGFLDNVRVWSQVRTPEQLCASALTCR